MRTLTIFFTLLLPAAAFAADLTVKVVDPQYAAVAGAQVSLLCGAENKTVIATQTTSAEGTATLPTKRNEPCQIRVLAPGFAEDFAAVPTEPQLKIVLRLATASQTVVVTATRTPVPGEDSGADVDVLNGSQLTAMQPTAAADAVRFLPGAIINAAGQRGGLTSLFVRGGESRYNKVIVDGVTVNEPGGTFDFGTLPMTEADRLEFVRGAQSTLYGSDAMTSVVQMWTRTGSTPTPELSFGADGGNLETANGYLSLAGAHGRFDYNVFGDQFNTGGQGPNDDYSNSLQGGNIGVALSDRMAFRLRARHSNSRTGVQNEWNFNGNPLLSPDLDQRARDNGFLSSAQLTLTGPARWQHRFTGFEYSLKRLNRHDVPHRGCDPASFNFLDSFFSDTGHINRAGFDYQGDYRPLSWAQSTFGYEFEDEDGIFNSQFLSLDFNNQPFIAKQQTRGLRLNHALLLQQRVTRGGFSVIGGLRYVHNQSFGDRVVPHTALTFLARR